MRGDANREAGNKLMGTGDEVTLPKIVSKAYTAALAGEILTCRV